MKNWIVGVLAAIFVIVLIVSFTGGGDDSSEPMPAENTVATASPTPAPTPTAPPALSNSEILEKADDCLDPSDSNHNGFEDQVRPLLDDEDSMSTLDTRLGIPSAPNEIPITMDYEADNIYGVSIKTSARGVLDHETCNVTVTETGVQKIASSREQPPLEQRIIRCLNPWDGNHDGFENQIRPLLNDEDSMRTLRTYWLDGAIPNASDEIYLAMEYQARNLYGGTVKTIAWGLLNLRTCRINVTDPGF